MSLKLALPCALLTLLTVGSGGALAQVNPDPDVLGLYFDTAATTTAAEVPVFTPFNMYLIVTNPTAVTGISGWECSIEKTSAAFFKTGETLAGGSDWASGEYDYFVPIGRPLALPSQPVVLLATIRCFMLDTNPCEFYLHPGTRPSVPGAMIYAADNDPGDFRILNWSSGAEETPVAVLNPPSTTVTIDVNPDSIAAPWSVSGPNGFAAAGNGDQVFADAEPGTYVTVWGDVFGWATPPPDTLTVALSESIVFTGNYLPGGTVVVDPSPDTLDAPWQLDGPGGYTTAGQGDQTLGPLPAGVYDLAWGDVPGWAAPPPDTLTVAMGDTIVFSGEYLPGPVVVIDPSPDTLDAPWQLDGPGGYAATGHGDQMLGPLTAGAYALTWQDVFGWRTPPPDTLVAAAQDTVVFAAAYTPAAAITEIGDVGNDQGGQARIVFARCVYDAAGDPVTVTAYGVYRRQDQYKASDKILGWDFLATVPAHGEAYYQCVVPTLCDSTAEAGICWSVYFVRTMTDDPLTFYDSAPDSGYSIDNLEPNVPAGLAVAFAAAGNLISWTQNEEPDVRYYCVYRRERAAKDPGFGELVQKVTGTAWTDDLSGAPGNSWDYIYGVTAVDFAGNESDVTAWEDTEVSGADGLPLPRDCRLYPCYPNPFNPVATIAFDLPDGRKASLQVYDLSGRLVRTLADQVAFGPGRHEILWEGRDDTGREVAAGVYCYRLRAGDYSMTMRMTLVK